MIYTVTFNPSLDYIVTVDDFKLGLTNRTTSELNASRWKSGLTYPSYWETSESTIPHLGFTAGFTGKEIVRRVEELGVKSDFIPIEEGFSRINLKVEIHRRNRDQRKRSCHQSGENRSVDGKASRTDQ